MKNIQLFNGLFEIPATFLESSKTRFIKMELDGKILYRAPIWSFGNAKIAPSVAVQSFPVMETCRGICHGCYAKRLETLRPNIHASHLLTYLAFALHRESVVRESIAMLQGIALARFNVFGEITIITAKTFIEIAKACPQTKFNIYTKRQGFLEDFSTVNNIYCHYSNGINYFPKKELAEKARETGYDVCPYSKDRNGACGRLCVKCWTHCKPVLFEKH